MVKFQHTSQRFFDVLSTSVTFKWRLFAVKMMPYVFVYCRSLCYQIIHSVFLIFTKHTLLQIITLIVSQKLISASLCLMLFINMSLFLSCCLFLSFIFLRLQRIRLKNHQRRSYHLKEYTMFEEFSVWEKKRRKNIYSLSQ